MVRWRWWLLALPLLITCRPEPTPKVSASPPVVVSAPVPSAPPAASSAPTPAVSSASLPSYGDEPGWIACGRTRCEAHKEICCLSWENTRDPSHEPRCVPAPQRDQIAPGSRSLFDSVAWAEPFYKACNGDAARLCDGPGDCDAGQVCCDEWVWLQASEFAMMQGCKRLEAGLPTCMHAEVCNDKDKQCTRPSASCLPHHSQNRGECVGPYRKKPNCGDAPCPEGSWCVESSSKRSCVPNRPWWPEEGLIECDRGSDCAEGLSCFNSVAGEIGHRCDRQSSALNYAEHALCDTAADCTSLCGRDLVPSCRTDTSVAFEPQVRAPNKGFCECHKRCKRDKDCEYDCTAATIQRGVFHPMMVGVCDRRTNVCGCREGKAAP